MKYASLGPSTKNKNLLGPLSLLTRQAETPVTILFNPTSNYFSKLSNQIMWKKTLKDSTKMLELVNLAKLQDTNAIHKNQLHYI